MYEVAPLHPCFDKNASPEAIRRLCLEGLNLVEKLFMSNKYDILILEEINVCLKDGFIKEAELEDIMRKKPANLELILTGRGAAKNIIKQADLVSIIEAMKHPYNNKVKAREGIEY